MVLNNNKFSKSVCKLIQTLTYTDDIDKIGSSVGSKLVAEVLFRLQVRPGIWDCSSAHGLGMGQELGMRLILGIRVRLSMGRGPEIELVLEQWLMLGMGQGMKAEYGA